MTFKRGREEVLTDNDVFSDDFVKELDRKAWAQFEVSCAKMHEMAKQFDTEYKNGFHVGATINIRVANRWKK